MNETIFSALNGFAGHSTLLDSFFVFFSNSFGFFLIAGLLVFLALHEDKKKGARDISVVLSAAACAYLVAFAIKHLFPHPRPFEVLQNMHLLYDHDGGDSFPSGHATFYMALASALWFYHRKLAYAYGAGALLIGIMRVVVGVHWPIDVFAGFILGGSVGASIFWVYQTYYTRFHAFGVRMQEILRG